MKKVDVKYVIIDEIFHIVPGVRPPASLSDLIWESRSDTRADMEMSCNNLLIYHALLQYTTRDYVSFI